MFVNVFTFFQIPAVCSTSFYYLFLNYVLKPKNTFWDIAVERSAPCYLTVRFVLASCFEF